jgi:hypothetical protein
MTKQQLEYALTPFCMGKRTLLDFVQDIWNSSTPLPNMGKGPDTKLISTKLFYSFAKLVEQENG